MRIVLDRRAQRQGLLVAVSAASARAGSFNSAAIALGGNGVAGMQHRQAADQIFQLAHIARPAMAAQNLQPFAVQRLGRQAFVFRLAQEMAHQIGNVLDRARAAAAGAAARH